VSARTQVLLAKAGRHLAAKEVEAAAEVYRGLERRGTSAIPAAAATNLSFLYLLEGDLSAAVHYTDLALKADRWGSLQAAAGALPRLCPHVCTDQPRPVPGAALAAATRPGTTRRRT
jgi:hypothetical protein